MDKLELFEPVKDDNVSSLVRKYVERVCNVSKRLPLYTIIIYLVLLLLSVGLISMFKGQPFTEILVFGIPLQGAWAKTDPELLTACIIGSATVAVIVSILYYKRVISDFNSILLEDCDGYEYLVLAKYGVYHPVNYASEIVFQYAYATALCIHGKFEEALNFVAPFENDKKKRNIWLSVKLNTAESDEEFNLYYEQLKKKGLFKIVKLYRDGKYDETINYIRTNIEMKPSYKAAIGSYYLTRAYEATNRYEEAFVAISGCLANSEYLPLLHEKASEIYARLSNMLFSMDKMMEPEVSAKPDDYEEVSEEPEVSAKPDDYEEVSEEPEVSSDFEEVSNQSEEVSAKPDDCEEVSEESETSAKPDEEL